MKDKFVDGNMYYTQNPLAMFKIILGKASQEDGIKFLNFFPCDCSVKIRWDDVDMAADFNEYLKRHNIPEQK